MSFALWLRQCSQAFMATKRHASKPSRKPRLALDELESRLVPASNVTIDLVDPPPFFVEGVAVNYAGNVEGAAGTTKFAWKAHKDGAEFANGNNPHFEVIPNDDAEYVVTLEVTDADGTISASTMFVARNQAPVVSVSGPTTGEAGQLLTFTLSASDAGTDEGAGFTYVIDWNNDRTPDQTIDATADNGDGVSVEHAFTVAGEHTFTVTATDEDVATSDPVTHTVTVTASVPGPDPVPGPTPPSLGVVNGVLYVQGTEEDDKIQILPHKRQRAENTSVRVKINGVVVGTFSGVNSIQISALGGNDWVHLSGSIKVPATIDGGAGNDWLSGGAGDDLILGGEGDDLLLGHKGNDVLIGGLGHDFLHGGPGDDSLNGLSGNDWHFADAESDFGPGKKRGRGMAHHHD